MHKPLLLLLFLFTTATHAADCDYLASPPDAGRASGQKTIAQAWYGGATSRYAHGVLGDAIEADTLYVLPQGHDGCALALTLDTDTVFEDVTPRIADVTGDAQEDIITIESDAQAGAALAIYSIKNNQLIRVAATPFIGTRYRWLAPIGTADFNRDNIADVAYVERPHLAGVLMIWSFAGEQPVLLASQPGFSNHRIGENYNTGGIATCGDTPQIIIPDRRWQQTMAITLKNDQLAAAAVAPDISPATIDKYLACR